MTDTPQEYKEIAPYDDSEFRKEMSVLIEEPGFENAIRYVMPDADFAELKASLLKLNTKEEFQKLVMVNILLMLEKKTQPESQRPALTGSTRPKALCSSQTTVTSCWMPLSSDSP